MFEYEIIENLGEINRKNGRTVEVNIISYQQKPPKIDIRRWSEDHQFMGKGIALTEEEAKTLYAILKERYE